MNITLLGMHPYDLARLAREQGHQVWLEAADQAEEAGMPWEVAAGYRLRAAIGDRPNGVEVWQGTTVTAPGTPHVTSGIVVRFWEGRPGRSPRTQWEYSSGTRQWNVWRMAAPQPHGVGSFDWIACHAAAPPEVEAAVWAAATFGGTS